MKTNWFGTIVAAGALQLAMFAQQPYPPQGYPSDQYGNPQYQTDPAYGPDYGDPAYQNSDGVYAPAPPPPPSYAYAQPIAPGPDYLWVNRYWNWVGARYVWVGGYWCRPPFAGAYWIGPRYVGGRYFLGHWGGYSRPVYRAPVYGYRDSRPGWGYREPYHAPRYEYRGGGEHRWEGGRHEGWHRR